MITNDLKSLMELLNPACVNALQAAAGFAITREHYEISHEHLLLKLLEEGSGDVPPILHHFGIDSGRFQDGLLESLAGFRTGNTGRPKFSPILLDLLEKSWLVASIELQQQQIRSGAVLAVLADHAEIVGDPKTVELLGEIDTGRLRDEFGTIVDGSSEDRPTYARPTVAAAGKDGKKGTTALDQFTVDLTEQARTGKIDPVFARDLEIRQVIDILMRRRQNNPILVGEPGTGKTAIVEGMALRVVSGDVPDFLKDISIRSLDMGLLQAGAGVKGEFENRMRAVIEEVKASEKPIITFIDEAHTLIGAGGQAGTSDAANLLKPALARGELRTIAATTWSEYKKYIEKDPALERRFQPVKVAEPTIDGATTMLRGLKGKFEDAHKIRILDSAVEASVELSHRYISGRFLPDKAVSLLDTAAARARISMSAKPYRVEAIEREISHLEIEIAARKRDIEGGTVAAGDVLAEREALLVEKRNQLVEVSAAYEAERAAFDAVHAARGEVAAAGESEDGADAPAEQAGDIAGALAAFRATQGEETMIDLEVDAAVVAKVVADWTGVPVGKMVQDEAVTILDLKQTLGKRLLGQDGALEAVVRQVQTNKAGLADPEKPIGVFLLVGPSGVGKTELALLLADTLFGGERFVVKVNMSEYQEEHTISRLIGSPPGYVGYGEGGILTEAVRQRPYSVVLLDEVEKAHPKIMQLFLQIFDKGVCQDGEGREINFRNTLIVMTSNLGFQVAPPEWQAAGKDFTDWLEYVTGLDAAELAETVKPLLGTRFMPELLARLTVVPFYPIGSEIMKDIARLKLGKVARRMEEGNRIELTFTDAVLDAIAARCTEVQTGARNVDHILTGTLLPQIGRALLGRMTEGEPPSGLAIDIGDGGEFTYRFA